MKPSNFPGRKKQRRQQALKFRLKDEQKYLKRLKELEAGLNNEKLSKPRQRDIKHQIAKYARKLSVTKNEIEILQKRIKQCVQTSH